MLEITIVGDTNDADYVTSINPISEEDLAKIMPLIEAIKNFKPYKVEVDGLTWTHAGNFADSEYTRDDLGEKLASEIYKGIVDEDTFELFYELIPHGEDGIHSIESITVCPLVEKRVLL